MFRTALLLSFTTLALGLSAGDLKVSVKAVESTVKSIDDIVITAVVSNPTDSDIRVLSRSNILDPSATRSFAVTKDGENALFTGIRGSYDLSHDSHYTNIPAQGSVAVNHTNLAALYDFATHGTGTFTFTPNSVFQTGPDTPAVKIDADAVKIQITSDVEKRELISLTKRLSTPTCSDAGRLQTLKDSLSYARSLAGGAATDIRSHPTSSEWNSYFGGNSQDDIWYRLDIIAGDLASSGTRQIHCSGDPANLCSGGGVIAYTYIFTSNGAIVSSDIYTCDYFFTSTGTTPGICTGGFDATQSSRGGVLLHELSHATSGTNDIAYGCTACASLGATDKRNNADNYRCMGLAIYKHYNC